MAPVMDTPTAPGTPLHHEQVVYTRKQHLTHLQGKGNSAVSIHAQPYTLIFTINLLWKPKVMNSSFLSKALDK